MATLKGDGKTLIVIFIGAIIAAVLIGSIANQVTIVARATAVTNESLSVASAVGTIANVSNNTLFSIGHTNWTAAPTAVRAGNGTLFTSAVDYNTSLTTYKIWFYNTNPVNTSLKSSQNITNVDYSFTFNDYITDSASRNTIEIVLLMAALAVVVFVIVSLLRPGSTLSELMKR